MTSCQYKPSPRQIFLPVRYYVFASAPTLTRTRATHMYLLTLVSDGISGPSTSSVPHNGAWNNLAYLKPDL